MDKKAAEEKAFLDFQEIAEETQQSSRPDRVSQQQASPLGRIVLAFANTPMQYMRLTKKAVLDLKNGRGDAKTNITKDTLLLRLFRMLYSQDCNPHCIRRRFLKRKTKKQLKTISN